MKLERALLVLGALFAFAAVCFGQLNRASLSGTITDASGAVVPSAKITVTNDVTHDQLTTTSNGSGVYDLVAIPIGTYTVVVEKEGFANNTSSGVHLLMGASVLLDFTLAVKSVAQQVEVKTEAPAMLMEERSSTEGTLIETTQLAEMPLQVSGEKRDPSSFFQTIPGFVASTAGFQNNINGGMGGYSEIQMDGVSADTYAAMRGAMEGSPSVEVMDEFKVVQSIAPEYGATGGSFISFVSKSGTNQLHGDAYDYVRNQDLDGRSFFASNVAVDQQNEIGATLGGPVVLPKIYNGHNKTFFFVNFTLYLYHSTTAGAVYTLPTPAMQGGDLTGFLGSQIGTDQLGRPVYSGEIYDPSTTRSDGAGGFIRDPLTYNGKLNMINPAVFSSVSKKWNSFYPSGISSALVNNYVGASGLSSTWNDDIFGKIDQNIRTGRLLVSYRIENDHSKSSFNLPAFFGGNPSDSQLMDPTVTWTQPLAGGRAVNVAGATVMRNHARGFQTNATDGVGANLIGLTGTYNPGTPQVGIAGPYQNNFPNNYEGIWTPQQDELETTQGAQDVVTITKGKHTIKFGDIYQRFRTNYPTTLFANGRFLFNATETNLPDAFSSATGNSYASFLLGDVDSATVYGPNIDAERYWSDNIFIQDEHRVTPKLTLTYGLDWDLQNILSAPFNDMSQWDPTVANPGCGGCLGAQTFLGFGTGTLNRKRFLTMDKHQFSPRLGFAYLITPKTTIRGSYGFVYGPIGQALSAAWADHQGFLREFTTESTNGGVTPAFNWDNGFPISRFNTTIPTLDPTIANGDATSYVGKGTPKPPDVQLINFTVQRQIPGNIVLSIAYIGNMSHHVGTVNDQLFNQLNYAQYGYLGSLLTAPYNSPGAVAAGIVAPYPGFQGSVAQALRPYPQYLGINGDSSFIGNDAYNSMQIKAQKTFSNGLSFLIGWTYSKQLGDVDYLPGYFAAGIQNAYNMRTEKAVTSVDMPNVVVANYVYELPVGSGRKFLHGNDVLSKYILGGWSLSGVHTYDAGTPMVFSTNGRLPTTADTLTQVVSPLRADVISGVNPIVGSGCGGSFNPTVDVLLNRAAFADPAPYTFGNAPRLASYARSCASFNENMSLLKTAPIREKANLEFGFDVFNVFNRRHFGAPDSDIDDTTFGYVGSAGPGRTAQLHLKLKW
jgi:hypothetical protein